MTHFSFPCVLLWLNLWWTLRRELSLIPAFRIHSRVSTSLFNPMWQSVLSFSLSSPSYSFSPSNLCRIWFHTQNALPSYSKSTSPLGSAQVLSSKKPSLSTHWAFFTSSVFSLDSLSLVCVFNYNTLFCLKIFSFTGFELLAASVSYLKVPWGQRPCLILSGFPPGPASNTGLGS